MSAKTEDPPTKKAKQSSPSKSCPSSFRNELPSLLTQLNGGKALDLSVIAAIKEAGKIGEDTAAGALTVEDNPHNDTLKCTINKLFANHVGKTPEIVIVNAIRHAKDQRNFEGYIFNKTKSIMGMSGDEHRKYYNHPDNPLGIKGPKPDCKVWLELFLGKERADELLRDAVPLNGDDDLTGDDNVMEVTICEALEKEASQLYTIDLLANILQYTRKKAKSTSLNDLLRLSVVYGLDGVMKDILRGGYGSIADDLNINTPLPLDDKPLVNEGRPSLLDDRKMYMPAYALAALLGHENVVVAALAQGGNFDVPYGIQFDNGEEVKIIDNHNLPSGLFFWIFQKNMPEMITCLVNDCGFQFRWIDSDRGGHMDRIFHRLFDANEFESSPKWRGAIYDEDMMWESRRERYRMRAAAAYTEQMKMLDLLISLGLPFSLLFPVQPPIEMEEALIKDKKLETREECKAYMRSMDKGERKARELVYEACSAYNSLQSEEPETLTIGDFYRKLKSRWDGQKSVQTDRLPNFEQLDSTWRATRRPQNEDEYHESDSYHDSDDGSSYGDGPFG